MAPASSAAFVREIACHAFEARVGLRREAGVDQHDLRNGLLLAVRVGQGAALEQGQRQAVAQKSAAAGDQYVHDFLIGLRFGIP
jgi:hypothetical protein